MTESLSNDYEIVIVGGGAAGLSAALVLARARRRVLVVDSGAPRNAAAAHLQGYLSRDGMAPAALLAEGRREVEHYGATVVDDTVTQVVRSGPDRFRVLLAGGGPVSARRLLVATGLRDELPDVPGLRQRWARDVLHCPYCHGWEVRDQPLGVLGRGPESVHYAQLVRQWSKDVVLFVPPGVLTPADRTGLLARAVGVVEGTVARVVVEDDRLTGVQLDDGRTVTRSALFAPPTFVPNHDLLKGLGCEIDDQGWVVTGPGGATTVPGVWVAGNVSSARAQLITAAGEGAAAAGVINFDLVEEDVRDAVHDLEAVARPDR